MPLKVKCRCGTVLTVPAQRIGKSVRCPACRETVVIKPAESKEQRRRSRQSKPTGEQSSATKESPAEKPVAGTPAAKKQTSPKTSSNRKSSTERFKGGEEAGSASPRQDQKKPVERDKNASETKPAQKADKPKRADTQSKQSKAAKPDKKLTQTTDEGPLAKVESDAKKEDTQPGVAATKKPPKKTIEVEDRKPESPDAPESKESKPKSKTLETKKASNTPDEAKLNKDRKKPSPRSDKDDKTQETKVRDAKPATTAKKLPPALKRSPSTSKNQTTENCGDRERSEEQRKLKDKFETPSVKSEKEKQPPPLRSKGAPARKDSQTALDKAKAKPTVPPLHKPTSEPQAAAKRQRQKSVPKRSARPKKKDRSRTKGAGDRAGERSVLRGVHHDPAKRWSAYYLAIGVIVVALFNMAPAFYEGYDAYRLDPPRPMARWAFAAFVVGLLQLAYAFYLIQLPDWASVWVVAILSLAATTMYAALASVVVFGGQDSNLLESLQLSYVARKKAMLWCTIMLTISAVLTYFGGRIGIRWHKAFSIAYPTKTSPPSS